MSRRHQRSVAEWITLAASTAVLLVVVALLVVQIGQGDEPAAPVAVVHDVREVGGQFHVDVGVTNEGDRTAANVQVVAELDVDGHVISGDQTIDFLAGGEDSDLVFVFGDDPSRGSLTVAVTGYEVP